MIYSFSFAQNCKYQVTINSENLKEKGKFKLTIVNTDSQSFQIPIKINLCNMRLVDLEFFNDATQTFEKKTLSNKDIDCFKPDIMKKLKPNKTFIYTVNMQSDLDVIERINFFKDHKNSKYRFKISFAINNYKNCGALNTDWIYKN